ncbi:hypothetical protein SOVF_046950 [Spinacia oleracea]|uniref:Zinc finger CCCH domain-containing protein 43 n=1 Tax=Spinacia oleracea TaxID=3562 RepID=A0A9R0IVU7_SPIOL|nr:zinc finger CCCH domain-containing protein 43 [Spinacia oleracea]KNA21028.1 hypothetical protein SOVF_046950 [Spinacia oleracea]
MELGLDSSSTTCPLGLSLSKQQEISAIDSPEHPSPSFDDHQSSDSINDNLGSLTLVEVPDINRGDLTAERENNDEENGEIESVRKDELSGRSSSGSFHTEIDAADNNVSLDGDLTAETDNHEENWEIENVSKGEDSEKELSCRISINRLQTEIGSAYDNGGDDSNRTEEGENNEEHNVEEKQEIENPRIDDEDGEKELTCRSSSNSNMFQTEIDADNNGVEGGFSTEEKENSEEEIGDEKQEIENMSQNEDSEKELSNISSRSQTEIDTENNGGEDGDCRVEKGDNEENGEEAEEVENVSKNEGSEKESSRRRSSSHRFPVRPESEDCAFFLRTGTCKFGMNCKFNHPPNHKKLQGAKVKTKEECAGSATQRVIENYESADKEQVDCKYFDRQGGCKFGKACKFNHSKKVNSTLKFNFLGLPIRLGENKCPFYMRTGSCKFGTNCRFNHPDPTSAGGPDASPRYSNGGSIFSPNASQSTLAPWSPTAVNESPYMLPLMYSPTQGVPSQSDWNAYQAPVYPPERSVHIPPTYAMHSSIQERPQQMHGDDFPERPGQPECSYFVRNGDCKYRSACKFHHPKIATAQSPSCLLSDLGLPLRSGENVCSYYSRYGICKYGPACKHDHPINHAHSSMLTVSAVDQPSLLGQPPGRDS